MGRLWGDSHAVSSNSADVVNEDKSNLSEAIPSDAPDKSHVLDTFISSGGAASTLPSEEPTIRTAPIRYSLRDRSRIKLPQRLRQLTGRVRDKSSEKGRVM